MEIDLRQAESVKVTTDFSIDTLQYLGTVNYKQTCIKPC